MFYSHDILTRRGGRFYVLWFAATKATKLTRREYANVNIERMCDDITSYFPSRRTNAESMRMKFSLYLSSQLMYGIVVVYSKQQEYLLSDLRKAQETLQSAPIFCPAIDLPASKVNIDTSDVLALRKGNPWGFNNFGTTNFSPKQSSFVSGVATADEFSVGFPPAPHTVHLDKITLREEIDEIAKGFGDAQDDFLPPYEDYYATMVAIADEGLNLQAETELLMDRALESPRLSAVSAVEETPAVLVPPETPITVEAPPRASKPRTPEITMAELEIGPEPEQAQARFQLSPLPPEADRGYLFNRKGRRGAKRLKIDEKISISGAEMEEQIQNFQDTIRPVGELIIYPNRAVFAAKNEWWKLTSIDIGSKSLTDIFRANASVPRHETIDMNEIWNSPPWTIPHEFHYQPQSPSAAQEFVANFQQGHPIEPILEERQEDELGQTTASSIEHQREMSSRREQDWILPRPSSIYDPRGDQNEPYGDLVEPPPLQDIDFPIPMQEASIIADDIQPIAEEFGHGVEPQPKAKRQRVRSPAPVDQLITCFPPVSDIPGGDCRTFALRREQLINELKEKTAGGRVITFQDLVPLNKSRAQAGKTFYMLLDLIGKKIIDAEQRRPYEEITIFLGSRVGAKR